jgi:hypothetical protein
MRPVVSLLLSAAILCAEVLPYDMRPETNATLPHITLLDQKTLTCKTVDGVPFTELSDLAYAPTSQTLHLISDKGNVYQFHAVFDQHITALSSAHGHYLHKPGGKHLRHSKRDSEGLALDARGRLWVSFERKPHVANIAPDGKMIRYVSLPKALRNAKKYRSKNKGMESLAWHPRHGLIAALEYPPKGMPRHHQTLYALSGKQWHFRAENIPGNGISAIETMDDGTILVLERAFDKKHLTLVITLKKVYLHKQKNSLCHTKILAQMSTDNGWMLDNFEGLARVAPHRYVMISDDNGNFFQKTLLVYFEVTE